MDAKADNGESAPIKTRSKLDVRPIALALPLDIVDHRGGTNNIAILLFHTE